MVVQGFDVAILARGAACKIATAGAEAVLLFFIVRLLAFAFTKFMLHLFAYLLRFGCNHGQLDVGVGQFALLCQTQQLL